MILKQPRSTSVNPSQRATLSVTALGTPAPAYQWLKEGVAVPGATSAVLTIAAAGAADTGNYSVVVSNSAGAVVSAAATLAVIPGTSAPVVAAQPVSQTALHGGSVTLNVTASASPAPAYQWLRNGQALTGATSPSLTLTGVTRETAGTYSAVISNAVGSIVSAPATLTVATGSALSNLSVRTAMEIGQTLIVGAVVSGSPKPLLVRAAGPALNAFGLTGLADPRLEFYTTGPAPVLANDDWPANLAAAFGAAGAFPFPVGSKDAALQQTLAGSFTVQARGTGPGVVLVEAYDQAGGTAARLVNLSARNRVGTGADLLIAGFAISGTGTKQVLIRAVGPTLASFGVAGTLVDPRLAVLSGSTILAENDNWASRVGAAGLATPADFAAVGAFPLTTGSRDAAVLLTLNAGTTYTVQVAGVNGSTGEALIEIYEVF